jgi:hyaluronoglucosaminidase
MWRPILRQNFGSLVPCKTVSYDIERSLHPSLNRTQAELEASRRFENAGRQFMETTLMLARQLRPAARWGYYAFPYCFNGNEDEDCSPATRAENDQLHWLFEATDLVLPSVYMSERHLKAHNRPKMIRGRVREAVRVAQKQTHKPPVLAYVRSVFTDTRRFLSRDDWQTVLETSKQTGASGVILWGSSSDLNTRQKCVDFADYLETTMGPMIVQYAGGEEIQQPLPPPRDHLPIFVILVLSLSLCSLMLVYLAWALWRHSKSSMQFLPQSEGGS